MCEVQLAAQPTFEIAAFWTLERHIKRARAVNTPTSAQPKGQQFYVKLPANIRRIKKLFLECLRVQTLRPMLSKIVP